MAGAQYNIAGWVDRVIFPVKHCLTHAPKHSSHHSTPLQSTRLPNTTNLDRLLDQSTLPPSHPLHYYCRLVFASGSCPVDGASSLLEVLSCPMGVAGRCGWGFSCSQGPTSCGTLSAHDTKIELSTCMGRLHQQQQFCCFAKHRLVGPVHNEISKGHEEDSFDLDSRNLQGLPFGLVYLSIDRRVRNTVIFLTTHKTITGDTYFKYWNLRQLCWYFQEN